MKINGGATLWARQTINSDIFFNKPDKWFKIWFYLINEANHSDDRQFKRGSCFLKYEWIMEKTKATKNEVDHCIRWLKSATMIATAKATGGFTVKILNYNVFQSLESYKSDSKSDRSGETKAKQKRNKSDSKYKNDNNVKNEKKDTLSGRCALIIDYLNEKTGRNEPGQKPIDPKKAVSYLRARFNEGRTVKDCIDVIDIKLKDWLNDEEMFEFLRPSTLFNKTKFENYITKKRPDKFSKYLKKE